MKYNITVDYSITLPSECFAANFSEVWTDLVPCCTDEEGFTRVQRDLVAASSDGGEDVDTASG